MEILAQNRNIRGAKAVTAELYFDVRKAEQFENTLAVD